ncbi:MAG: AAA family ATPase [Actinomycetota bacterium]
MKAIVDRSVVESETSARCLAYLDPAAMDGLEVAAGDVVELSTELGRRAVARLGEPRDSDRGSGVLRLDRFARQALKARMNDRVEVRRVELDPARRVVVAAPVDVSRAHGLLQHLRDLFARSATPCLEGGKLYATFAGSAAGTVYDVVEVEPSPGVFTADTELEIEAPQVRMAEGALDVTLEDIGGLHRQVALVRELVQLPLQLPFVYRQLGITAPRGVILYGPPGCGKTHLAKALATDVKAKFFFINGPAVVGTMQGETESNLRRIFNEAAHHAPSLVFIDELDAIAPHRERSGSQSEVRAVTTLLSAMDGLGKVDGVVVIGTTNRLEAVDVALRRPGRFDREVFIGPPDAEGRLEILQIQTREMPLSGAAVDHLPAVARATHGFVGADLMELAREAGLSALRRTTPILDDHRGAFRIGDDLDVTLEPADFDEALTRIRPSALREAFVTFPEVAWEDIGGLEPVKRRLRNLVERPLHDPGVFRAVGADAPRGILLAGPPGTGKTMLVHALARSANVNFVAIDGPEIFSKWLGESEEAIRQVFRVARQLAPTILFFDQIDALAPPRGSDLGSKTTERVVNQLLAELDAAREGTELVVVAATNRPDLVDEAVLRPGRLGARIEVPLPDRQARAQIIRLLLRDALIDAELPVDDIAGELAEATEARSGADLASLVERAKLAALEESDFTTPVPLRAEHLRRALEGFAERNSRGEVPGGCEYR